MPSTPNTKSLQPVCDCDDGVYKLGRSNYYKYRAANLMFGFNTLITSKLSCFAEFNALRKNQLLAFYEELKPLLSECVGTKRTSTKYRDYYFMAQFEVSNRPAHMGTHPPLAPWDPSHLPLTPSLYDDTWRAGRAAGADRCSSLHL